MRVQCNVEFSLSSALVTVVGARSAQQKRPLRSMKVSSAYLPVGPPQRWKWRAPATIECNLAPPVLHRRFSSLEVPATLALTPSWSCSMRVTRSR